MTLSSRSRTSGRFARLMELYERNYILVRLLAPRLRAMEGGAHLSEVPGAAALELSRVAHERYTTTFRLTHRFSARERHAREPDLAIRLYHDARTCEVIGGHLPRRCEGSGGPQRLRELDESLRLNRFLERWLRYCLDQGHRFAAAPSVPESRPERSRADSLRQAVHAPEARHPATADTLRSWPAAPGS